MFTGSVLFAVGTRRGKAEEWIRALPERFPRLDIRVTRAEDLAGLASTANEAAVFVVDTPYADIGKFRTDAALVLEQGGKVYLEYFPAEPLISLIQADQRSGSLIGAESLREDLQSLQDISAYEADLDVLERQFAERKPKQKQQLNAECALEGIP